jgi:hypothetical protein
VHGWIDHIYVNCAEGAKCAEIYAKLWGAPAETLFEKAAAKPHS